MAVIKYSLLVLT